MVSYILVVSLMMMIGLIKARSFILTEPDSNIQFKMNRPIRWRTMPGNKRKQNGNGRHVILSPENIITDDFDSE